MPRSGFYSVLIVAGIGAALLTIILAAVQPTHVARSADGQGSYELLAGAALLVAAGVFGLRRDVRKAQRTHHRD